MATAPFQVDLSFLRPPKPAAPAATATQPSTGAPKLIPYNEGPRMETELKDLRVENMGNVPEDLKAFMESLAVLYRIVLHSRVAADSKTAKREFDPDTDSVRVLDALVVAAFLNNDPSDLLRTYFANNKLQLRYEHFEKYASPELRSIFWAPGMEGIETWKYVSKDKAQQLWRTALDADNAITDAAQKKTKTDAAMAMYGSYRSLLMDVFRKSYVAQMTLYLDKTSARLSGRVRRDIENSMAAHQNLPAAVLEATILNQMVNLFKQGYKFDTSDLWKKYQSSSAGDVLDGTIRRYLELFNDTRTEEILQKKTEAMQLKQTTAAIQSQLQNQLQSSVFSRPLPYWVNTNAPKTIVTSVNFQRKPRAASRSASKKRRNARRAEKKKRAEQEAKKTKVVVEEKKGGDRGRKSSTTSSSSSRSSRDHKRHRPADAGAASSRVSRRRHDERAEAKAPRQHHSRRAAEDDVEFGY